METIRRKVRELVDITNRDMVNKLTEDIGIDVFCTPFQQVSWDLAVNKMTDIVLELLRGECK